MPTTSSIVRQQLKSERRRNRRRRSLLLESLEDRAIPAAGLDLVYHQVGQINRVGQVVHVTVPVPATDFTLSANGRVLLGFACEPSESSSLDPAAFGLRPSGGAAASVLRRTSNLPGEKSALTLASVRPGGTFDLALKGSARTTGKFDLSVYLAGDVNDDGRVDAADVSIIKGLAGVKKIDPRYQLEGDVNRNGIIDRIDQNLAARNLGVIVQAPRAERRLHESSGLVAQSSVPVALGGPGAGSRIIRIPVSTRFDTSDIGAATEDTFLIYLVDPSDPSRTLLDRGRRGTSLFSVSDGKTEMIPGSVRYDGSTVEVDVTSLPESQGLLIFQLVNNDSDTGSFVRAGPATVANDVFGTARPAFPVSSDLASVGPSLDLTGLSATSDVHVGFQNVRVDAAGTYTAEMVLRNDGPPIARAAAVAFTSLPGGVTLTNPSGLDVQNRPYINFGDAIPNGGLATGQESRPIEVAFADPTGVPMRLTMAVLVGGPNQAPVLDPIGPLTVTVGQRLTVPIAAIDPDGDSLILSVDSPRLPTGTLSNGNLTLAPVPADIGSYTFDVIASDGVLATRQSVSLTVAADADTTTRLSGVIRDAAGNPLADIPVELSGTNTTTAADGSFRLTFPGSFPAGPLVIHGEQSPAATEYPLVKIDPAILLGRAAINGIDNAIPQAIYLTAVDGVNAVAVNPSADSTITSAAVPGASLFIAANTTTYAGPLALTEVDRDQMPAALPAGTSPDLIVSVEPSGATAAVQFMTPAALTLPNRAGWAAGRLLDLFVLDPATGLFTDKGDGRIATTGTTVETTAGGVSDSGLYFFVPRPDVALDPAEVIFNEDTSGVEQTETAALTSEVELHSGAVRETHDLVTYQSVGASRGLSLRYDSLRSDPRPIIHFGLPNVDPAALAGADADRLRLVARMTIRRGTFTYEVPGAPAILGLPAGYHFWQVPAAGGRVEAALQPDLSALPTGQYEYEVIVGLVLLDEAETQAVGTSQTVTGRLIHVNSIGSSLGHGWGLAGVQQLIENADGSLLLVDGDGSEMRFAPPAAAGDPYISPAGDHTTLEKVDEGSGPIFRRTTHDMTISRFDAENRLASVTDRNGNRTSYAYDGLGRLESMIDPANLKTTLTYGADFVDIEDPASRVTRLDFDDAGNLAKITDSDDSTRTFGYDSAHHLVSEIDKRGFIEQTDYGFHGRAIRGERGDFSEILVDAVQVHGLFRPEETIDPTAPPTATALATSGLSADPSGSVTGIELDQYGQAISEEDALGLVLSEIERDSDHEVTQVRKFGNRFEIVYDAAGNPIAIRDSLAQTTEGYNYLYGGSNGFYHWEVTAVADFNIDGAADVACSADNGVAIFLGAGDGTFYLANALLATTPQVLATDLNSDGKPDLVLEERGTVRTMLGQGNGLFVQKSQVVLSTYPARFSVALGELNADGNQDLVLLNPFGPIISLLGIGDGAFAEPVLGDDVGVTWTWYEIPVPIALGDLNADGRDDLVFALSELNVYLNNGTGAFLSADVYSTTNYLPHGIVVADLNGDSYLDVAVQTIEPGSFRNLSVLLNAGDGTLGTPTPVFTFIVYEPNVVNADDVTGDGINDLIVLQFPETMRVLRGDGLGGFTPQSAIPSGTSMGFEDFAIADVDGDGDRDFLATAIDGHYPPTQFLSVRLNDGSGALDPIEPQLHTAKYDPVFNQLIETTDALGRRTVNEIDPANGNRLKETRIVGAPGGDDDVAKLFTYTPQGLIDTAIDACGCSGVMDNDYDAFGRLIKTTFAIGKPEEAFRLYEYDAAGNRTAEIDEIGNRTEFVYDVMNRLTQVTQADPDGVGPLLSPVFQYTYDTAGNRISMTDPLGHVINLDYDARNRVIKRTEPELVGPVPIPRSVTTMEYDASGNLIREVDPLGRVMNYEYDARNRRVKTIDPAGGITLEEYDGAGNRTALIDPVGNRTTFSYDLRNRLLSETDALGKSIVHSYDAADQLVKTVDRDGRSILYQYDSLGRLVTETWRNLNGTVANVIQSTYDARGNRLVVADYFSKLISTFDARNRATSVDNAGLPDTPHVVLAYAYDAVGNVLSVTETIDGQSGAVTEYTCDALNRVIRITQSGDAVAEKRVDFEYNGIGQTVGLDRFADLAGTLPVIQSEYGYDGMNRLVSLMHKDDDVQVVSYLQQFNAASEITKAIINGRAIINYTYDLTGQLIRTSSGPVAYFYDANGNRTGRYVTGPGNRLLTDGRYTYDYDDEGNLIKRTETATDRAREFVWDHRNRLVQVTDKNALGVATMVARYTYDADDRRIAKDVDTAPQDAEPGTTIHFVYDREDVLLEFIDVDGTGGDAPVLAIRYLHGPGIDEVLAQEDVRVDINTATRVLWLLPDPLGTTRDLVDQTGRVRNHIIYDAFGHVVFQSNPRFSTRFLFTGREFDGETGLYFYRSRYYNPRIGRFLSEDRIRFKAGDTNIFRYVHNVPVSRKDPSGRDDELRTLVGVVLGVLFGAFDSKCESYYKRQNIKAGESDDDAERHAKQKCGVEWLFLIGLAAVAAGRWESERRRRKALKDCDPKSPMPDRDEPITSAN